jgi:hypothetical protein
MHAFILLGISVQFLDEQRARGAESLYTAGAFKIRSNRNRLARGEVGCGKKGELASPRLGALEPKSGTALDPAVNGVVLALPRIRQSI